MASRSILVRSSSHHGSARKDGSRRIGPVNTHNLISIRRAVHSIANVLIYGIVRSFSRPHQINHAIANTSRRERRDEKIRRRQEQLRSFDDWLLAHPNLSTLIAVMVALLVLGLAFLLKQLLGGY